MPEIDQQRHYVAVQLAGLIVHAAQRKPPQIEITDARIVVDALANYTMQLALDRLANAGVRISAAKLASVLLPDQTETTPDPG